MDNKIKFFIFIQILFLFPINIVCEVINPECSNNIDIALPNENDKSSYYRCINGELLTIICEDGVFNPVIQACESSKSGNIGIALPDCPRNQSNTIYFPHDEYCNKFYTCTNGLLTEMTCPEGTEFDENTNTCQWISDSGCSSKPTHGIKAIKESIHDLPKDESTDKTYYNGKPFYKRAK